MIDVTSMIHSTQYTVFKIWLAIDEFCNNAVQIVYVASS